MIRAHADLIARLSDEQATALAARLVESELIHVSLSTISGPSLAEVCVAEDLSHAQVVLSCSSMSGEFWVRLISDLLQRPMYMCARGETGIALTDIEGRPLPTPIGHRIGEAPASPSVPHRVRLQKAPKRDPRVVVSVAPNPKHPLSAAHARYAIWAVGMTVDQFVAAGGHRADVAHDVSKGFVVLEMPS